MLLIGNLLGEQAMADKKDDPFAVKPNNKMPYIAGGMIAFALLWFVYDLNPGGMVRSETKEETKVRVQQERDDALDKARAKKKPPGH